MVNYFASHLICLLAKNLLLSFGLLQSTCVPVAEGFTDAVLESLPSKGGGLNLIHMRGMLTQSQIQFSSLPPHSPDY